MRIFKSVSRWSFTGTGNQEICGFGCSVNILPCDASLSVRFSSRLMLFVSCPSIGSDWRLRNKHHPLQPYLVSENWTFRGRNTRGMREKFPFRAIVSFTISGLQNIVYFFLKHLQTQETRWNIWSSICNFLWNISASWFVQCSTNNYVSVLYMVCHLLRKTYTYERA